MGICLFAATTKFNCAVNNMKSCPKIHCVGKQNPAVGYQRKGNTFVNEREKDSGGQNTSEGGYKPSQTPKTGVVFVCWRNL